MFRLIVALALLPGLAAVKSAPALRGETVPASAADLRVDIDGPEGGIAPLVPQHVVKWSEQSKLPKAVQYLLAGLWVGMLGSLPFLLPVMDHKPVTRSQIIVGATMLTVLLGGFWLFTNVILFQSVHFDKIRPLTNVECIYFMSQVITTVGYGDVTPAKVRGQIFVAFYVLGALFVIAMLLSDLTNHVLAKIEDYKQELKDRQLSARSTGGCAVSNVLALITPEKPSPKGLFSALAVFAALDICWVIFFSMYPGEGKTLFQAIYMSIITLSTVGFGYFTPITEEGMIFGAFFMLFGASALANVISEFTALMVELNEYERFCPATRKAQALEEIKDFSGGSGQVSESDFLQFTLLHLDLVSKSELEHILETFQSLGPKRSSVSLKTIEASLAEDAA